MKEIKLSDILAELCGLDLTGLYERDFWDLTAKSQGELAAIFAVADALRSFREKNYATVLFHTGLAIWEGEKTGAYAAFVAACNMLGLSVVTLERVDAAALTATQADVICCERELGALSDQLYREGTITQRPLSLPRRTALAYVLAALHESGGASQLWGKEMSGWAGLPPDAEALCRKFGMGLSREGTQARQDLAAQANLLEPYVLAAMVVLGKCPDVTGSLTRLQRQGTPRRII